MTAATGGWLLLLGAGLAPAMRVALKPAAWREYRAQPWVPGLLIALSVAGALATLRLHARYAWWLPSLTIAVVVAAAASWWRARPAWGTGRGLARGSLGIGASLDALADPAFYANEATKHGPVFKTAQFHRPVLVITSLPRGLDVLERERHNLRLPSLPFWRQSPVEYMAFLGDVRHPRHRAILVTALDSTVVQCADTGLSTALHQHLERAASMRGDDGIPPDTFLPGAAFACMLGAIFGVSPADPRISELRARFDALGVRRWYDPGRPWQRPPFVPLVHLVRALGEEARDSLAGGGTTPSLLGEIVRAGAHHLQDEILLGNLVLFFHVTRSNVLAVLRWTFHELSTRPDFPEALRTLSARDAEGGAKAGELAGHFVDEVLRLHQSEFIYREVVREIMVDGHRVPRGWLLRVGVREGHDDPAVFPEPHRFDPRRFAGRRYDRTQYCPWSDGTHSAFGAALAHAISKHLVTVIATDFDVRTIAGGPPERDGNRHWSHWRPSRATRVRVTRRPAAPAA